MAAVLKAPAQPQKQGTDITILTIWQVLLGIGAFYAVSRILQFDDFFKLGSIVKIFLTIAVGAYGIAALSSAWWIRRLNNRGRLIGMVVNIVAAILFGLYLAHLLGLYLGIDDLADGLYKNNGWLLAIAAGYLVVWLGNRFDADSRLNQALTRIGLGIMMLSLVVLLLASGLAESAGDLVRGLLRGDSLAIVAGMVAFTVAALALMRRGTLFNETIPERDSWQGWLFLMPNFVSFALFFALPLLLSFYLSFTDYDAVSKANWVGIANYQELLSVDIRTVPAGTKEIAFNTNHFEILRLNIGANDVVVGARDPLFYQSLAQTFRYCLFLALLSVAPALGLALLLNAKIPGMNFFRAVYFLPSIAAVVGVSLIWRWLYDPTIGYFNYTIGQIATLLNSIFGTQFDPKFNWLTDDNLLLISVVIMASWQAIGFNTVIFLAGLQGIPKDIMEAATVDGAGRWTRFRSIMLPMIAPTTFFILVTTLISGLQVFSEIFALLSSNTSNARLTLVFYLYQQGFVSFRMGYASATAWVLFIFIFIITLLQFRISNRSQAYAD